MGQIADDIQNGFQCSWCGVYFEQAHGYPVACARDFAEIEKEEPQNIELIKDLQGKVVGKMHEPSGVQKAIFAEL